MFSEGSCSSLSVLLLKGKTVKTSTIRVVRQVLSNLNDYSKKMKVASKYLRKGKMKVFLETFLARF